MMKMMTRLALAVMLTASSVGGAGATETTLYERNLEALLELLNHGEDVELDLAGLEATVITRDGTATMPLLDALGVQAQYLTDRGIDLSGTQNTDAAGTGAWPVLAADGYAIDLAYSDALALFGTAGTSASCAGGIKEVPVTPSPIFGDVGVYAQDITRATTTVTGIDLSLGNNGLAFSVNPLTTAIDDTVVYGDGALSNAAPATVVGGSNYDVVCLELFVDLWYLQWDVVLAIGGTLAGGYTEDIVQATALL